MVASQPHVSFPKHALGRWNFPSRGKVVQGICLPLFFPLSSSPLSLSALHSRDHGRVDVSRVVATVKVSEGEYSDSVVGGGQRVEDGESSETDGGQG